MVSVLRIEKLRWGLSAKRLNEALEKVDAYVATLRHDLDAAESNILDAQGAIEDIQSTLDDIQDALATIDSTLTQINQTLADHESRISALENPG
jgi:chromosome segregation ATPase